MYPYILTPWGKIQTFSLFVCIGILLMILCVYRSIKDEDDEQAFIFPVIVISGLFGFVSAVIADIIFKYIEYSVLKLYGITFYGGMIGASLMMLILLKLRKSNTRYSVLEWFNILTPPFILFHFFGRLGCFFGGCCYGRTSDSIFALPFPDNPDMNIIHNGLKCYPTQLFEAALLIVIFFAVIRTANRFRTYLCLYAISRFCIEFLRGDDRGLAFTILSPSQLISLLIILALIIDYIYRRIGKRTAHRSFSE
ncbi:MAG: prolipoprotein diacylglyceryl transferase [Clostridia bacterium]|nr:prolipoprotein diacylglyceryl transferase [Clostridia bacterium]